MNRWFGLGLLLITIGALALRAPQLSLRPMHNDEAVNALKIEKLWEQGRYAYDPNEHHGPTLYYATLPFVWLSGAQDYDRLSEAALRAVSVFFGLALIAGLVFLADGLGRPAILIAALLTALSPAMVFYSRYFIHEMLLVCFTLLVIAAGWRYARNPSAVWAAAGGAGLGLMYATKETFVLALAAMAGGLALALAWERWARQETPPWRAYWNPKHAGLAVAAAAVVALLFFTSFFTNASGPLDSVRTYLPWLKRAGGDSPHIHPWYFYLERLVWFKEVRGPVWTEGVIVLLAGVAAVAAFRRDSLAGANLFLVRFLTFYTVLLAAIYAAISYKTPWCLLGFWSGTILLAGVGAVLLVRLVRWRAAQVTVALLLLGAGGHLGWQAWRASYVFAADRRNPYVYAQTVPNLLKLADQVQALARAHPEGADMLVKVMASESDYWPLPWYLRGFNRVGWWDRVPADPYAPVIIAGAGLNASLDERSDRDWLMVNFFELRPKVFLELYVQFDLWKRYLETRPPVADD